MKRIFKNSIFPLLLIISTFTFSSCEEDCWFIDGEWRIVEVARYHGECPYYIGDILTFYPDGEFYVRGSHNFHERGYWDVVGHHLYIDFDGDGHDEIRAKIRQGDADYMVLDAEDYSYRSEYTLRMVRY